MAKEKKWDREFPVKLSPKSLRIVDGWEIVAETIEVDRSIVVEEKEEEEKKSREGRGGE
ncbi:hypothetical protein ACJMK2_040431 [Sinanodonta woodiana]|uniref:Uncharacterized protein n=1 Tax=Sinanodonta woodiana TaxID=1069815 RepID=A0ABD3W0Y9_SINWO